MMMCDVIMCCQTEGNLFILVNVVLGIKTVTWTIQANYNQVLLYFYLLFEIEKCIFVFLNIIRDYSEQ